MSLQDISEHKAILIADSQAAEKYKALLDSFKELYDNGFPDKNEREDYESILNRICNKEEIPRSIIIIYCDQTEQKALGGLAADWYGKLGALHLTYLLVDPQMRKQGISKKLINDGIPVIKNHLEAVENVRIVNNFFESNNPFNVIEDNFDPKTRLEIFSKLGAKIIPINYVQPSLSKGRKKVENLLLFTFSQFNADPERMPVDDVIEFLGEFYHILGYDDADPDLQKMIRQIICLGKASEDGGRSYLEPESVIEQPAYGFKKCSVTNHYILTVENNSPVKHCDDYFSFETDLFNYKNQVERPFTTCLEKYIPNAQIIMPDMYCYISEGRTHIRFTCRKTLNVTISISQTRIGGCSIAHFSVEPANNTEFSELDIIKLSSLFGSRQERVQYLGEILAKDTETDSPESFPAMLSRYLGGGTYSHLKTGIIQLNTANITESAHFFEIMHSDDSDIFDYEPDEKTENFANMICGITLGIFDFNRMDIIEVEDTLRPFSKTPKSFNVICRGALLAITSDEGLLTVKSDLIVSPYLLIPNTVLAFNRYILDEAENELENHLNDKMRSKSTIPILESCSKKIENILNKRYLHDIFHYLSEQKIIEVGNKQRGISTSLSKIKSRQIDLAGLIESKHNDNSNISDAILNVLLGVIAFLQIKYLLDSPIARVTAYFGYNDNVASLLSYILVPIVGFIIYKIVREKQISDDT